MTNTETKSCLYKARIFHHRMEPKHHRFYYNIFMFYLDLNEIETLSKKLRWFSYNRFNLFNFCDKDHLQLPASNPDQSKNIRAHITEYLRTNGVEIGKGRIMLLTNLRTLGHQFNPVSFYFCYDEADSPLCSVVEVSNTFHEMKPYFLGPDNWFDNRFHLNTTKYFYVSPFVDMDTQFDFSLIPPDEKLKIKIDDFDQKGRRFFTSTLNGTKVPLTDANMLRYFFSFPFITIQVIALIHWQALKLWIKKIPYHKKEADKNLQKDVYKPYK